MFRISYIENATNCIMHKGGFKQVSQAMTWIEENKKSIIPLKLLVWNDYIDCYSTLEKF